MPNQPNYLALLALQAALYFVVALLLVLSLSVVGALISINYVARRYKVWPLVKCLRYSGPRATWKFHRMKGRKHA